jgi:hypothetical protein
VPVPGVPGKVYAVQLRGVMATEVIHLEPNKEPTAPAHGLNRVVFAMQKMFHKRSWGV